MRIKIEGKYYTIEDVSNYGHLPLLTMEDGSEWHVAEDNYTAGQAAREYWEDMANNDPEELTHIVGEKALIAWGLGQQYAVGYESAGSLQEWLDLWENVPEEHFGGYDGCEYSVDRSGRVQDEVDFIPTVAYRWN